MILGSASGRGCCDGRRDKKLSVAVALLWPSDLGLTAYPCALILACMKLRTLVKVVTIIMALALPHGPSTASAQEKHAMPEESFISLFLERQRAGSGTGMLTNEATEYIGSCCDNRDEAIQLLHANGFKITITSDPAKVSELNKHWQTTAESYSEFISGTRGSSLWRFWEVFTVYRVVLFIKDEKVDRVWAAVDTTFP